MPNRNVAVGLRIGKVLPDHTFRSAVTSCPAAIIRLSSRRDWSIQIRRRAFVESCMRDNVITLLTLQIELRVMLRGASSEQARNQARLSYRPARVSMLSREKTKEHRRPATCASMSKSNAIFKKTCGHPASRPPRKLL